MKTILTILFLLLNTSIAFSQNHTISGFVRDKANGEDLTGASVYVKELNIGTTSNQYGFYSLTLPEGSYHIVFSFLGFGNVDTLVQCNKNHKISIYLQNRAVLTDEVVVSGERSDQNVRDHIGMVKIQPKDIQKVPAFLGEADILKTIQLLPGVQSAGEGISGYYVRGGGPDQNLVLIDEAVVYNASHLFGFFSVFNGDAIRDVNLIKGGMPANYGGRLSSVLDVSLKEGNLRKYEVDGSLGLISSKITVQGPIKKDTCSFLFTARRTYIDALVKPFLPKFEKTKDYEGSGYYFYDLNFKTNYRFSAKDRLFASFYFGRDVFSYDNKDTEFNVDIPWGNLTSSVRWNHLFGDKLFMNLTGIVSDYNYKFQANQNDYIFELVSGIRDYNVKCDFTWMPSVRHHIKYGANYVYHIFNPGTATAPVGDDDLDFGETVNQYAHDIALYFNDEFDVTEKFSINVGIRPTLFQQIGPFERFVKGQYDKTVDTLRFGKFEEVATYKHIEPRISAKYLITSSMSLKVAYTQNYQYIHLATISSASMPTDLWVPSSDVVVPQFGIQYSLGLFKNFSADMYETSIEGYYKELSYQIEYEDGATPSDNFGDNADNYFTSGSGTSYGVELFFKKNRGKLTGWIGYTWSKTMRVFEDINGGKPFPAKYDRRHDLSFSATYDFSEKWSGSLVFVYATGNAVTLPLSRFFIDGRLVSEYMDRNSYRMDSYHRMDLSATYHDKEKMESKKYKRYWNFSIYNVYNRANPYFIYYDFDGDLISGNFVTRARQVSLFPILPSVTFRIKFL